MTGALAWQVTYFNKRSQFLCLGRWHGFFARLSPSCGVFALSKIPPSLFFSVPSGRELSNSLMQRHQSTNQLVNNFDGRSHAGIVINKLAITKDPFYRSCTLGFRTLKVGLLLNAI